MMGFEIFDFGLLDVDSSSAESLSRQKFLTSQ